MSDGGGYFGGWRARAFTIMVRRGLFLLGGLCLLLFTVAPRPAAADDDSAEVHGSYEYVLDMANAEVEVSVDLAIAAVRPDEQTESGLYQYFLFRYQMVVPTAAQDLVVSDDAGPLVHTRDPVAVEGFDLVTIELRENLFFGDSTMVSVDYTLADDLANFATDQAGTAVIVNPASAGWFVFTDAGLDSWEVIVTVPSGFELVQNPEYPGPLTTDTGRLRASGGDNAAFAFVLFERETGAVESTMRAAGTDIVLRHWPGDMVWINQVRHEMETNLGVLVELVGQPWPDRALTVQESALPLSSPYAGWYLADDHRIVIGPRTDELTVMHEVAHVWFNHDTLGPRWLMEGLASEFAALAVAGDGLPAEPPAVSLDDEAAHPLAAWDSYDPDIEAWDYDASWQLIRSIHNTMGWEPFQSAVQSATRGEIPYPGPRPAGSRPVGDDFRFLDYAEQAAPDADLAPMIAAWVDGGWSDQYQRRSEAREIYLEGEADPGGWTAPYGVRLAMASWDFDQASALMVAAAETRSVRDRTNLGLNEVGVVVPAAFEHRFELATSEAELAGIARSIEAQGRALTDLEEASNGLGPVERIGLIGSGFDHDRQMASALFTTGQFSEMESAVDSADTSLDSAWRTGWIRITTTLALVLVTLWWVRRRRRSWL